MIRVGFLGVAHMHSYGYAPAVAGHPSASLVCVYEADPEIGKAFCERFQIPLLSSPQEVLEQVDAVIICSENVRHSELGCLAVKAGRAVLCEKPLVTTIEEGRDLIEAVNESGVPFMTAFPCRYSAAFATLKQRVQNGDLGQIKAVCATNRGRCPWGWFVEPAKSGGGAMIDHVVHVTDLLRVLLGSEVTHVQAQIGNNMYGQEWDDTAMLTLEFESGVFATLDSSWSRHASYKTWGDVTMKVIGEKGVIELDMFGQSLEFFRGDSPTHVAMGYGSDLDAGLVNDFLRSVEQGTPPPITVEDGFAASLVAIRGYESAKARSVVVA